MGKSTMFDGFTFVSGTYTSSEAKRLLRSAMETLAERSDLKRLGINPEPAKGAIVATGLDSVWNVFTFTAKSGPFNRVPHLTLGIGRDGVSAMATLPNGAPKKLSKPLLEDGLEGFKGMVEQVLAAMEGQLLGACRSLEPRLRVWHRHWDARRKPPVHDAILNADLRTLNGDARAKVKPLPVWIDTAFYALKRKGRANLELQIGAAFSYDACDHIGTRRSLDHVAAAWIACRPFLRKLGVG